MLAKIKSSVFIDALKLELQVPSGCCVRGVLRDDTGMVCRTIRQEVKKEKEELTLSGLNDLPYGRYTLELSEGSDEMRMQLVKRV
ncbi:MAG TPA: hypothetical protein PK275_12640 [Chitinophagaceae bacterium]|nr:hypothetical protein [Chitinophagaceae bacterium]